MNKSVSVFFATFCLILSQPALAQQGSSGVQTLRGADVAVTDQVPAARPYAGKAPGSQKPIALTFSTQPPLIPHSIEDLDEVTLQDNPCISCHGPANYKNAGAPKTADSHFKDRDGKTLSGVSPARYQCTACHVPQVDARPLVQNTFRSVVEAKKKK